jgi:hypothetical protein
VELVDEDRIDLKAAKGAATNPDDLDRALMSGD